MLLEIKGRKIGKGRPLVCVSVTERRAEAVLEELAYLSKSDADMIEWRLDCFEGVCDCNAIRAVLSAAAPLLKEKIFLYTFRSREQGGAAELADEAVEDVHQLAAEAGCVDFVDLEYFREKHPARKIQRLRNGGVRVIASHHDFLETPKPEVMHLLLERMRAGGADVVKLAVMPQSAADVLELLKVTAEFRENYPQTPIITMSMGALGSISRICGETFGSCVTFGAHRRASAPGQYELGRLCGILDAIHENSQIEI